MKKIVFVLLFVLMGLTSCDLFSNDQDLAVAKLKSLIEVIEKYDYIGFEEMIADDVKEEVDSETLTKQFGELSSYYNGEYNKLIDSAISTADSSGEGKTSKSFEASFDVLSSTDTYRFALKWVHSGSESSVGLSSIYIIKMTQDKYQDHAYWGDNLWTKGVNIGKVRLEPYPGE